MDKRLFIAGTVLCVASEAAFIGAVAQKIQITNNTKQSAQVGFTLPKKHRADIGITKIKNAQEKLHIAILKDSVAGIRDAVKEGADINVERKGKSPIMWAILLSRPNALKVLLQLGAIPDDECGKQAIKVKSIKDLLLLVKHGRINFDIKGVMASLPAFLRWQDGIQDAVDLIKELIVQGHDVNQFWHPIISLGSRAVEDLEMFQFLMFRGANPNYVIRDTRKGHEKVLMTPLSIASISCSNKRTIKRLIEVGADVNQNVNHQACGDQKSLLSCVIDRQIGSRGKHGQEVIELLLEHGATL